MGKENESGGAAIVRTAEESKSLARVLAGEAPDRMRYWCNGCGFVDQTKLDADGRPSVLHPRGLTLQFEPDEIAAFDGDLSLYTGPCPVCNFQTLVPFDSPFAAEHRSIVGDARAEKRREFEDQADVIVSRVKSEVGGIFAGGVSVPGSQPDPIDPPPSSGDDDEES